MNDIYDDPIADEECQKADDRRDEEWDQSWFDEMKDQTMENLNAVIETARIMAEHQVGKSLIDRARKASPGEAI